MEKGKKILGLDYGSKRIGVAIGFLDSKISLPQEIIENKGLNFVIEKIKNLIKEEEIDLIVVGLPKSLSSQKESQQLKDTKEFIKKLKKKINLDIAEEDERLSTREAQGLLLGGKQGKRDDVAAMLILQSYMKKISL